MKTLSRSSMLVFAVLLLAASASAQWTNVAPGLLGNDPSYGAMQYRDGVVWAGFADLWSSVDLGVTWKKVASFPPADTITDIAFYDNLTGLVSTLHSVLLTKDGGASWTQLMFTQDNIFKKVSFNGSQSVIQTIIDNGIFYSSVDGGVNWSASSFSGGNRSFAVANDGTVYVMSQDFPSYLGWVSASGDLGKSWSPNGQAVNADCYTLSVDSCDSKRLYLANEQVWNITNGIATFFLSLDGGATWQTTISQTEPYLSGTLTTTKYALFAGTDTTDGVLRSVDQGLTWKSIGGPAVSVDSRDIAAIDANTVFAADANGSIWVTRNGGNDSIASTRTDSITFSPATLFAADTIQCDSLTRTVRITRASCLSPYPGPATIVGPDSACFSIAASSGDSISVNLLPNSTGPLNAALVVSLTKGPNDTIPLHGFSAANPYRYNFTPASLFATDTIQCDSISRSVTIGRIGCYGASPKQFTIAGPDSSSFQIISSDSDSVSIVLLPNSTGALNASLVLTISDGTRYSLPLLGYCKTAIWAYKYTPANLFTTDTLWLCDQPVVDTILINASACKFPNVQSEGITGLDSNNYTLGQRITQPFSVFDTVILSFMPSDTGPRASTYRVLLDNGDSIVIPLGGYGSPPRPLALTTINAKTDTIGAAVNVPIKIGGLVRTENVDIVMHYDTRLEYENSFDMSGNKVDIPGQQWAGRSALHFPNAIPGIQQGYSVFNVWSDTAGQPLVTFDSLVVLSPEAPCEYILPPPDTCVITPMVGCGIEILSRWVHLGQTPRLSVQPNPSTGDVTISCDYDIGDVTIDVYDMLGTERGRVSATIAKSSPIQISLPATAGVYYIRVISQAGVENMNVVVAR
jgi:photosystem II stability/assembly factor-like uncharacterized protein